MVFKLLKIRREFFEFRIISAVPNVISNRQHVEGIAIMSSVELSHVVEKCVLVGEVEIVFKLCIDFECIRVILLCLSSFIWILERSLNGLCRSRFVVRLLFGPLGL